MSPVVITLVSDGRRCLLARQASFPKGMYSALSGFCDVGKEHFGSILYTYGCTIELCAPELSVALTQHRGMHEEYSVSCGSWN